MTAVLHPADGADPFTLAADLVDPTGGDRYRPRGGCAALYDATDDEVLIAGPAGTGKSRACLERLHALARRHAEMRCLIVRKTAASLGSTALVTWEQKVIADALVSGEVVWKAPTRRRPGQYVYRNGSVIVVGGMDKATKIMSSEYDIAYVQEAIELTENDWESITTRLRNGVTPHQQLIADTNPDVPTHWLKSRCDRGDTRLIESRHEDNPVFFTDPDADGVCVLTDAGVTYIGRLDRLSGVRHKRLRLGLWVAAEGQIYEGWDPAVHLVDPFDPPHDWVRWWTVDFGYRNPFVLQWWAQDPDGRLILYREIYRTGRLVEDHARAALDLVRGHDGRWVEPRPRAVICDHDAEDRATLERHLGMSTVPADKRVTPGIEAVQSRLRVDGTGRPGLTMMRDAVVDRDTELVEASKPSCTAEEIPGYVWAPGQDGKPAKEEPLKMDDHGCDAKRYLVAQVDLVGRPRVRFM